VALPGEAELFAEFANRMNPAKRAVQNGDFELGARLFIDVVLGTRHFDQLPAATKNRLFDNMRLIGAELTDINEIVTDIIRSDVATMKAPTLGLTGDESPEMSA
jgi:hypothetical protein